MISVAKDRNGICTQQTDGAGIVGSELTEYSLNLNDVVFSKNFEWEVLLLFEQCKSPCFPF